MQRCLQSMGTGEILPGISVAPRAQEESDLGCVLAGTHVFERSGAPRIPSQDGQSQFTAQSDLVFGSHHLLRDHFSCQACPIGSSCSIPPLSSTSPYSGARVLTADSGHSPATYSGQGVVAGCPKAPSLSKLALRHTCEQVALSNLAANMDTWIDDISVDMVSTCPAKVAAKSIQVLRMMSASLDADSLALSSAKSAFVCSGGAAQKRLQSLLRPGDPPILHL